jgi:hypothetical protein
MLARRIDSNPGDILEFDLAGIVEKLESNITTENIYVDQRVSGPNNAQILMDHGWQIYDYGTVSWWCGFLSSRYVPSVTEK